MRQEPTATPDPNHDHRGRIAMALLERCEEGVRSGRFGPTNRGNREARQLIRETLGRLIARTTDPALKDRARAVLAALDAADGVKAGKPTALPVAPTARGKGREAASGGYSAERVREAVLSGLERMIASGEIRGPRHRKDRKQLAAQMGRYLERETDPAKRARLEAIVRGLAEADWLPAPKDNPRVFSSWKAAQSIRAGKV